ncbi:hypothetical protein BT69DRAFT_1332046 [Atractiella rhizophila]|nr:hypothetical protein BT69DRAFT_1332046 [Atractiella rhizophila]
MSSNSNARSASPSPSPSNVPSTAPLVSSPEPGSSVLVSPASAPQQIRSDTLPPSAPSRFRSSSTLNPATARGRSTRSSSILTNPNAPVPVVYPSSSNNLPPIQRKSSIRVKRSTSAAPRVGIAGNAFKSGTGGSPAGGASAVGTQKSKGSFRTGNLEVIEDESPKLEPNALASADRRRSESAPHPPINTLAPPTSGGEFTGRRRGGSIAQRLRDDFDYSSSAVLPSSSSKSRPAIPFDKEELLGRTRSGSRATEDGVDPLERESSVRIRFREKDAEERLRSGSIGVRSSRLGSISGRRRAISAPLGPEQRGGGSKIKQGLFPNLDHMEIEDENDEHHLDHEVDLLEVVDPTVGAVAHMTNIQNSIFAPPIPFLRRPPVVELDLPSPTASEEDLRLEEGRTGLTEEDEEIDLLDRHVEKEMTRKDQVRKILKGVWAFMKTPLGIFFTIYGILVVFWGAGLVLILIGAFDLGAYQKKLWVEIASQILNGLFTITGVGLIPWRLIDTYHIWIISRYARKTRHRRKRKHLPKLHDINDIPMAAGYTDCDNPQEGTKHNQDKAGTDHSEEEEKNVKHDPAEELERAREELRQKEAAVGPEGEAEAAGHPFEHEDTVLSEEEEIKLRHAQGSKAPG